MDDVVFCGLGLATEPGRVMTPRRASEQLVALALELLDGRSPARVADVGTGSGAIAVAVASGLRGAEVWATDTSRRAVALARRNVRRHGLGDRVRVRHGDLLDPVPGRLDLILANLPYLPGAAAGRCPAFAGEPPSALFAGGDGLGPYRRLVALSAVRLAPAGVLAIQLHRRVLAARRDELGLLREVLGGGGGLTWPAGAAA